MASSRYCATCLTTFRDDPDACPNLACGRPKPSKGWSPLLGPGDLLDRNYRIVKPLAVGGAGLTYLAREIDDQGRPVEPDLAIKVLYTERDSGPFLRRLSNEAQILQGLDHDNIVQCRGFVHRAGQPPYLVTLFERGGNLSHHIKRVGGLSPVVAAAVLRQVLHALDIAHAQGVVHRDLKPENVLLSEKVGADTVPRVRVADFGIAKVQGGVGAGLTRVGSFVGTPEYAAPEQFEGRGPTPATDVFAAGGLLYFLLCGRPPLEYSQRHDPATCYAEMLDQIPPRVPAVEDDPLRKRILQDLFDNMMCNVDTQRWTIRQVIARLDDLFAGTVSSTRAAPFAADDHADDTDEELVGGGSTFVWAPGEDAHGMPSNVAAGQLPGYSVEDDEDTLVLSDLGAAFASPPAAAPTVPPASRPRIRRKKRPNELSLDDLVGGSFEVDDEEELVPGAFSAPAVEVEESPPRRASSSFFDEAPPPSPPPPSSTVRPAPAAAEPARADPNAGLWVTDHPQPVPQPLPDSARGLLRLLGGVHAEHRDLVLTRLEQLDPSQIAAAMRSHRSGDDPLTGRGIGLAVAALKQTSWANQVRGLLRDPDPGVRACAARGLGEVASGGLLAQLSRLLGDPEAVVRAAAARALACACLRASQQGLGKSWLSRVQSDSSPVVVAAYTLAMQELN